MPENEAQANTKASRVSGFATRFVADVPKERRRGIARVHVFAKRGPRAYNHIYVLNWQLVLCCWFELVPTEGLMVDSVNQ